MKYTCKQCGKEFEITEGEAEFYRSKGLNLPKRCKECRAENKAKKSDAESEISKFNATRMPQRELSVDSKMIKIAVSIFVAVLAVIVGLVSIANYKSSKEDDYKETSSGYTYNPEIYYYDEEPTEYSETTENTGKRYSETEKIQSTAEETDNAVTTNQTTTTRPATTTRQATNSGGYAFRNTDRLQEHYAKHGTEVGASSAEQYQSMAASVITSPGVQHKNEADDGDDIYFKASTGEIVFVSGDGYIRTYFITDQDYFNRQ